MKKAIIDDGFNSELVYDAEFEGNLEIPKINKPQKIIIPKEIIPYSIFKTRKEYIRYNGGICFYEHDVKFADILKNPKEELENFKNLECVITPDCSLYRDMPLTAQIANVYRSRAIGYYLQKNGIYVIPNIRWGDERSYTNKVFNEKFAFLGIPKNSIVSIGTYGCIQSKESKKYFKEGLKEMIKELKPEVVLVYGSMPNIIFKDLKDETKFINYKDFISRRRKDVI